MPERLRKVLPLCAIGSLLAILVAGFGAAQEPIPLKQPDPVPAPLPVPGQPAQGDGPEVLAKGPVHEAFAATAEAPAATPIVAKQPPDPIEELPPDQKPEGDNVQWIPGYWHWDEESSRFIWISGFWRQPPPGRVWVPGSWREARGGWQWVPGFWQPVAAPKPQQPQQQPEIEYLNEPPVSVEVGPTVAAPTATCFYVPGSWVWRGRYVWRPGVWVEYRPTWVWVPARFQWTPAGYVFVEGYWDYPLGTRGVMFAPVAFPQAVYAQPGFVYTPVYVVSEPCMVGALFVRRGHACYYFGDYYDGAYATAGYTAWCGTYTRTGFTIGFGVGRSWGYDPLWSYYSVTYRDTPGWHRGVGDLYGGRYRGEIARPPVTLVQQNTTINNITKTTVVNVTNNVTVVNGATIVNNKDVSHVAMVAPLKVAPDLQRTKYQPVTVEARRAAAVTAKQFNEVSVQRSRQETALVAQAAARPMGLVGPAAPVQPRTVKLDVPRTAVTQAHVIDERKAPPPAPHQAGSAAHPKVDLPHTEVPRVDRGQVVLPRSDPHTTFPKVDPKGPVVLPKSDPRPDPAKIDPKGPPTTFPKIDPKGPLPKLPAPLPKGPQALPPKEHSKSEPSKP
ncbi:YXWGXW repeat-containing protein [Frigoriglobus tundricola]|uniref:YXWGXW repeat-containing protein n=1 Tax=Frigoriglobus tundricola TaxID=2774151 RepID=A0A6M5YT45_9BACT|nr:YXWGXW repeat-containing protein [Frigoriglobus tundricola]QJW96596.1 hypothetical protein FTUN_4153 [Frigoriglobus tundricola]